MGGYVTLPDCTGPSTFATRLLDAATVILDEVRGSERPGLEEKRLLSLADTILAEVRIQAKREGWNATVDIERITLPTGGEPAEMVL